MDETMRLTTVMLTVENGETSVRHVVVGLTRESCDALVKRIAAKAMRDGCSVRYPDGTTRWIETREVVDTTKSGSAAYTWAKDGNRVLCARRLHTVQPDGTDTVTALRPVYRDVF